MAPAAQISTASRILYSFFLFLKERMLFPIRLNCCFRMTFSIAESVLVFQEIVLLRRKNNRQHFPWKLREARLLVVKGTEENLLSKFPQ